MRRTERMAILTGLGWSEPSGALRSVAREGRSDGEQHEHSGRQRCDLWSRHLRRMGLLLATSSRLLGARLRDLRGPLLAGLHGLRGLPGAWCLIVAGPRRPGSARN